jgi:hypothetical protein
LFEKSKLIIGLIFATLIFYLVSIAIPENIGYVDFSQYWTSAFLTIQGKNPYDPAQVGFIQKDFNLDFYPILMWNPPLVIPFFIPFSLFPFKIATKAWVLITISLFILAHRFLLKAYNNKRIKKAEIIVLATFYPLFIHVSYGQSSILILLGLSGFFYCSRKDPQLILSSKEAGIFLGLTAIKPHLLYLLYIAIFVESIRTKKFVMLFSSFVTCVFLLFVTHLLQPDIIAQYTTAWKTGPLSWHNPTLGSWLQGFLNIHTIWIRALPTFIGLCIFSYILLFKNIRFSRNLLTILIPLSVVSCPYAWVYDYVVILPFIVLYTSRSLIVAVTTVLANCTLMLFAANGTSQAYMLWYPIVLYLSYFFSKKSSHA